MVKLERWSGADALVMLHFFTVLESEREQYKDELLEVLNTHLMQNSKVVLTSRPLRGPCTSFSLSKARRFR